MLNENSFMTGLSIIKITPVDTGVIFILNRYNYFSSLQTSLKYL